MRVVFSDESGTSRAQDEPNTVVAAIMVDMDESWADLHSDLESLVTSQDIDPHSYELKATRLMRDIRKAHFHPSEKNENFKARAERLWIGAFGHLFQYRIPVFGAAVNRASYKTLCAKKPNFARISPYKMAFADCVYQIDEYAHHALRDEQVVWISDHAGEYEADLKQTVLTMRQSLPLWAKNDSPLPRILHVADTVYFGHSHESRALQLADLCATTIAYHLRGESAAEKYFAMLERRLVRDVRPMTFTVTM